ncbi:M14 family metallopeptidase [Flavobacteriaceae bacterium KMM 6898]|nr:M14 family metallopeptidase [Flavobacteriaceae bacterium KMM 6898]
MKNFKNKGPFFILIIIFCFLGCKSNTQWKGQEPIKKVSTETVPIQRQYKGVFDLGDGIYMSNDYSGARMNGVARINDTLLSVLITSENLPINPSPWYGFKIWSETEKDLYVKLTYNEDAFHRYFPKLSNNGSTWEALDSLKYSSVKKIFNERELAESITMKLSLSKDTLWISAQELITSSEVNSWTNKLITNSFVTKSTIGESNEGRPINLLKIGESDDKRMIMVISRQHPPEVTGFLAMQAFIETLCADTDLAKRFRATYNTYVVPLVNPDGADNGHWRHNYGGVDLNRDWESFNQPETRAIRDFMHQKVTQTGGKFYFGVDFHSTWEDIFYTISPELKGNMPGLVPKVISGLEDEFSGYKPNIRPSPGTGNKINSTAFFFFEFGAESFTYEVGDNTPREFVRKKGEITAIKLMEQLLK